jgi:hypothetical protein
VKYERRDEAARELKLSGDLIGYITADHDAASSALLHFDVAPPPLPLGLFQHRVRCERFAGVALVNDALVCADTSPLLDEQHATKQIWLHVTQIKAAHVAGVIDAAKKHGGGHAASLEMFAALTL